LEPKQLALTVSGSQPNGYWSIDMRQMRCWIFNISEQLSRPIFRQEQNFSVVHLSVILALNGNNVPFLVFFPRLNMGAKSKEVIVGLTAKRNAG